MSRPRAWTWRLRAEWHNVLRMVRDETSLPVLLATRDLETCFELAGHMLLLDAGRILQSGPPRKVLDQPAERGSRAPAGHPQPVPRRDRGARSRPQYQPPAPGKLRIDRSLPSRAACAAIASGCASSQASCAPSPHNGAKPSANQVAARLERASEMPQAVRLEFAGGIVAEVPRPEFERSRRIIRSGWWSFRRRR